MLHTVRIVAGNPSDSVMHAFIRQVDRRLIAMAMLFVWLFLFGSNVVNACLVELTPSQTMSHERHHRLPALAPSSLTADDQGHELTAWIYDGHEDVRTYPVHCLSAQTFMHVLAPWTSPNNTVERDVVMVTAAYPSIPLVSSGQQLTVRQVADPVAQAVPLFIRFRRLLP